MVHCVFTAYHPQVGRDNALGMAQMERMAGMARIFSAFLPTLFLPVPVAVEQL